MAEHPGNHSTLPSPLAHDLRNHLNAILGAARALHRAREKPEVAGEMLQIVEENVVQATELIARAAQTQPPG